MKNKPENPPAFPSEVKETVDDTVYTAYHEGLTMRDYFAAKAMQGFIHPDSFGDIDKMCQKSYQIADAMLKEREKAND